MNIAAKITIVMPALIHNGDNTHHHVQFMVPMSLRTINTIVSKPVNPIPVLLDDELLLMIIVFV